MSKSVDAFLRVVHGESYTLALEVVDLHLGRLAPVGRSEGEGEFSWSRGEEVR
jgi:hypothetical protein